MWQKKAEDADARGAKLTEKAREHYDKSATELEPFKIGTKVRVQDPHSKMWDRVGEVVGVGKHRDYHIKVPSGRVYWRNRRFLRRYYDAFEGGDEITDAEKERDYPPPPKNNDGKVTPRRSSRERKKTVKFGVNSIKFFEV